MIRLAPDEEDELRWYETGSYEGDMGRRSTQGGIQDTLERGALCQLGPKDGGGITDRALWAARRLRRVTEKIHRCTFTQSAVLRATFSRMPRDRKAGSRGLETETVWPLLWQAPSLVPDMSQLWEKDPLRGNRPVSAWLQHLDAVARSSTSLKAQRAAKTLYAIVGAAELVVLDALAAYRGEGLRTEAQAEGTFGLREIARVLGVSHHTVDARLTEAGVPRRGRMGPRGLSFRVRMSDLRIRAPDIAEAMDRSVSRRAS